MHQIGCPTDENMSEKVMKTLVSNEQSKFLLEHCKAQKKDRFQTQTKITETKMEISLCSEKMLQIQHTAS